MDIKFENPDKVLRAIAKLEPKKWKRKVLKEMRADHKPVRSTMRGNVPKDNGKLRRSIRTNSWIKNRRGGEVSLFVRTGPRFRKPGRVFYAHFVELGTNKTEAQPFVEPTYDAHKSAAKQGIVNAINNVFKSLK